MKMLIRMSAWLVLATAFAACGGSSSPTTANAPIQFDPAPMPTTATVGVVLTDYAVDDYEHAWATIVSVELFGADGSKQTIFEGEETVDLLALRDEVRLFAVNENVEPGDYTKVRLKATELILEKSTGNGPSQITAQLVGNGKIDLNPRQTITLNAGDVVFLSLDWDIEKSLKLTEAGKNKTKVIMRPVVFVDVDTEPAFKQGLVRINGVVAEVAQDNSYFRICSAEIPNASPTDTLVNELCVDVLVNDNTGIFDVKGAPMSDWPVGFEPKSEVSVLGLLRRAEDGASIQPLQDENGDLNPTVFQVLAIVVEGGTPGTWAQYAGALTSAPSAAVPPDSSTLDFELADTTPVTGQLSTAFRGSRVFRVSVDNGLEEIDPSMYSTELAAGDQAVMDAVSLPADVDGDPDVLNISIMLARTPTATEVITGEITGINVDDGTLDLLQDTMAWCVTTAGDTEIFQLFVDEDSVKAVPAELADLSTGSQALVSGTVNGCISADLIIAEAPVAAPL